MAEPFHRKWILKVQGERPYVADTVRFRDELIRNITTVKRKDVKVAEQVLMTPTSEPRTVNTWTVKAK